MYDVVDYSAVCNCGIPDHTHSLFEKKAVAKFTSLMYLTISG